MGFRTDIGNVVAANIDEVQGDLDEARHALQRVRLEAAQLERRVAALEVLLTLADEQLVGDTEPSQLTLHAAMTVVLESAVERMLRAGDLAAEINRRRLYKMRDGRPVEAQQIHARVGHYPHLFSKTGTFIKLSE